MSERSGGGPIKVAFVDDHPVLLEGICRIFQQKSEFDVVARGSSADDAVSIFNSNHPDMIFVDLSMKGDVFAAISDISSASGSTKVIVYSASSDADLMLKAFESGACAFVVKDSVADELFGAVQAVLRGETFVSRDYAGLLLSGLRNRTRRAAAPQVQLTRRERQVVEELLLARSNKQIAARMAISEKTVKHHMTNLMSKLGARNRVEVVLSAKQHSIGG